MKTSRTIKWKITRIVKFFNSRLSHDKKSLERIHKFNCWLSDLHKLGFYTEASVSQTQVAEESTPRKPKAAMPAARAEKKQGRVQVIVKKNNKE